MQFVSQFVFVIWRLLLIQIAKVGVALKNSGNLLHYRHKNFENQFRNSWAEICTWGQSRHLSEAQRQKIDFYVDYEETKAEAWSKQGYYSVVGMKIELV